MSDGVLAMSRAGEESVMVHRGACASVPAGVAGSGIGSTHPCSTDESEKEEKEAGSWSAVARRRRWTEGAKCLV